MTNRQGRAAAALGIGTAAAAGLFVMLWSTVGTAAPAVPRANGAAQSALVLSDFTVTYSYDQNGNRTKETGPALPENSGADKCGNGTSGLIPLFLNGQMVSVYPGVCQ